MKKAFVIFVFLVLIPGCFIGCSSKNNGEVKYSALSGQWGTENGDMLLSLGEASDKNTYHGAVSYYENGELTEDSFTYTLSYDKKTNLNTLSIVIDDYSETYEIKLNGEVLSLILYNDETAAKEETVFIKGKQLAVPESMQNVSELKAATTAAS